MQSRRVSEKERKKKNVINEIEKKGKPNRKKKK